LGEVHGLKKHGPNKKEHPIVEGSKDQECEDEEEVLLSELMEEENKKRVH